MSPRWRRPSPPPHGVRAMPSARNRAAATRERRGKAKRLRRRLSRPSLAPLRRRYHSRALLGAPAVGAPVPALRRGRPLPLGLRTVAPLSLAARIPRCVAAGCLRATRRAGMTQEAVGARRPWGRLCWPPPPCRKAALQLRALPCRRATGNFGYVEIRVAAPRALCPQLTSGVVVENRQLVATAVTLGL